MMYRVTPQGYKHYKEYTVDRKALQEIRDLVFAIRYNRLITAYKRYQDMTDRGLLISSEHIVRLQKIDLCSVLPDSMYQ